MELQQIDVFIEKDGQVHIEVHGAKGHSCLKLTEALEKALGGKVVDREMTPEADESEVETLPERLRNEISR